MPFRQAHFITGKAVAYAENLGLDLSELKINLILDVIEKRQDGYHNIDGIMQMIDLYDEVEVKISDKFEITSNSKDIPLDEKNLVYKVYKALKEKYKFNERFSILIEKNIPVSAGIAGGSTNSAVVIEMIDEILGLNMSLDDKKQIGKSVGADIPYLLVGKTARTRGIGDELEILDSLPTTDILIVNNGVEIATPYVYSNIVPSGNSDRIDKLINVYKNKNYDEFFKGLYNVMEKVYFVGRRHHRRPVPSRLAEGRARHGRHRHQAPCPTARS